VAETSKTVRTFFIVVLMKSCLVATITNAAQWNKHGFGRHLFLLLIDRTSPWIVVLVAAFGVFKASKGGCRPSCRAVNTIVIARRAFRMAY